MEDGDKTAGIGMVAFRCKGSEVLSRFFFSERIPGPVLNDLQRITTKVIAGLELLAAVKAVEVLRDLLTATRDNEAARANLIAMYSPVLTHAELLKHLWKMSRLKSIHLWISRVPSTSNIADEPSRFEVTKLVEAGFTRMHPRLP